MTWYQIVALLTAGPTALILLLRLYAFFKGFVEYTIAEALLLFICAVAIVLSFVGFR